MRRIREREKNITQLDFLKLQECADDGAIFEDTRPRRAPRLFVLEREGFIWMFALRGNWVKTFQKIPLGSRRAARFKRTLAKLNPLREQKNLEG